MNEVTYNTYLRMARLACDNIKREICKVCNSRDLTRVQVKVKNRDSVAQYVEKIVKNPGNAVAIYSSNAEQLFVVVTDLKYTLSVGVVFVESIVRSRAARVQQKLLVDLMSAEIYLQVAYEYDKSHPYKKLEESAVESAKHIIADKYAYKFLTNFDFSGKPCIRSTVSTELSKIAFHHMYSFSDIQTVTRMAQKNYFNTYAKRNDFFLGNAGSKPAYEQKPSTKNVAASNQEVFSNNNDPTPNINIITELYQGAFANLPLKNRIRKFVNLKVRNRDIMICPLRNLAVKRQYATIEAMTKNHYIMQFYDDHKPKSVNSMNIKDYYYQQEMKMYQHMWGTEELVYIKGGRMYFPNGTSIVVPHNTEPWSLLHKVNATYGSLFGYTSDDAEGGSNWLYDSIRCAYTDEGLAEYRLAMIDARLKGKI